LACILCGLLILVHHLIFWSRLFDIEDIMHHEFFAGVFITFGVSAFIFGARGEP
jgi:hypothetical protein